jgi:DNA-binding transcriptional regulator YbjK
MTDRMTVLADAAIHVVATQGMRGLTHRAVDARAGVPLGSTSAYFRTRKALVEGLVQRLADIETADIEANRLDPAALTGPIDLDQLAVGIAGLLDDWLTRGRERTLARYACLLEATHHPELRAILAHGDKPREQARQLLELAGSADPERHSRHLVAFIDGLAFDRLVGAGVTKAATPGTPENREELRQAVRAVLTAVVGK